MGRMMGFEPMYIGTTIRGLNHLTTPAISRSPNAVRIIYDSRVQTLSPLVRTYSRSLSEAVTCYFLTCAIGYNQHYIINILTVKAIILTKKISHFSRDFRLLY